MCLPQIYYISDQLSYFFMFIGNMVITIFEICSKKSNLFALQSHLHKIGLNEKIYSSIITPKGAYDKNFSSNSHIKQYTQILSVRSRLQHEKTKRNCNTYAIKTNLLPMEQNLERQMKNQICFFLGRKSRLLIRKSLCQQNALISICNYVTSRLRYRFFRFG